MNSNLPTPEKIGAVLANTFNMTPAETRPDAPLFSNGRLDSFHMVELLSRLEKEFNVRIGSGEVSLENLDTAERLAALVLRKISG